METQRGKRGRGQPKNAWNIPNQKPNPTPGAKTSQNSRDRDRAAAETRFQAAKAKLEQSVQKHMEYDDSSSEEEELQSDNILGSVLKSYANSGGVVNNLGRTQRFLEDAFQSGAATCLICIATVKRADSIWSCEECYCFFHLPCIQRWASDSIAQQKRSFEDLAPYERPPKLLWGCPKCRRDYEPEATPQRYVCFCGQTEDPTFQPWLVPHSCGETCGKLLQPECGHKCLLLCHPGPCPPCPQVVQCLCHCGQSPAQPRRCSDQRWSCGGTCRRMLGCSRHKCSSVCHEGVCEPCPRTSSQKCQCGGQEREQPCATPAWQCGKVCGRKLSCGHHSCQEVCHSGRCGSCPRAGSRTCPCGKSSHTSLSCTAEVPTCGDTCGKVLACGAHSCQERCHREQCGGCLQVSIKSCRCGLHQREMPCQKEFLCEVKCKRSRHCLRHPCNRKCCDGQCPPCEKPCGKTLGCGNHKCSGVCHRGPCYPCPLTETLACSCGDTTLTVPCGRRRQAKPPKCNKPCRVPPDCHHPYRLPHKCHAGECPPCRQVCGHKHPSCVHRCPAPCHSAVWVTSVVGGDKPLAGPWEKRESVTKKKSLPCPDCEVPMPVTCLGGHERSAWPCCKASPSSCGRRCGRRLACGNHQCVLACHLVVGATSELMAGSNCSQCEAACSLPRPPNCQHPCLAPCHPAPCKPCPQGVRLKCHCGVSQLHRPCAQWVNATPKQQESLLSCGNQCPKNYPCGHRCRATCHEGSCPEPESCQRKVKVPCACKRLRKEFSCEAVRNNTAKVACDEACKKKQQEEKKEREKEEAEKRREQERHDREELAQFEKRQGKRKARERRRRHSEEELPPAWHFYAKVGAAVLVVGMLLGLAVNMTS